MIRINLLPHREIKRAHRQRQFLLLAGASVAAAVIAVVLVHSVISGLVERQSARNRYLESEIAKLDKDIEEIKRLKEQTQALLARKQVVEALQINRTQGVQLLDQLARQLPEGIYLKAIKQTGANVTITGYAQSNARVSTLMRNLEASPWLESPNLVEIKAIVQGTTRSSEFTLIVGLTRAQPDPEQKAPGQPQPGSKT
jgi:type IV pilus assembly protein PilN